MATGVEIPAGDPAKSSTEISPGEQLFCVVGSSGLQGARDYFVENTDAPASLFKDCTSVSDVVRMAELYWKVTIIQHQGITRQKQAPEPTPTPTSWRAEYGTAAAQLVLVLNAFVLVALLAIENVQLMCLNETDIGKLARSIRQIQYAQKDMKFCLYVFCVEFFIVVAFFAPRVFFNERKKQE
jgi:hypothetical protein